MSLPTLFNNRYLTTDEVIEIIIKNNFINKISFITDILDLESDNSTDCNLLQPEIDYLLGDMSNKKVFGVHFLDLTTNLTYTIMKLENTNFWRYVSTQFHLF